jgi:2-polyprenyl-3-methyl-5-hydroxy-6-metoxy-1,4-benzoquinol methylase
MPVVKDRAKWLVERTKGKVVLDIGCSGNISKQIKAAAKTYYGVDKEAAEGVVGLDIDHRPDQIPVYEDVEIIILSEVLEHLANPGFFLAALRALYKGKEFVITVPVACAYAVSDGCEIVHGEHVAWYSYTTLKTLITRYGYAIKECSWFNGVPHKAEGVIMVLT